MPYSRRVRSSATTYSPKRSVPRGYFSIKWSMESCLMSRRSLEDRGLDRWTGILAFDSSDDGTEKEVGTIACTKIANEDMIPSSEYAYIFDCHSAELSEFAQLLDSSGGIRGDVRCEVGDPFEISATGSKLYVERVRVNPEFRGLGLGLFMVDDACRKLNDSMSLTFLQPAPFNDETVGNRDVAERKLRDYYGLLGFRALGDDWVARWNGYVLPDLQTVCSHLF